MTTKEKKIRAVFAVNDFLVGGVQRLYLELFRHLDSKVYELHLVTLMQFPGRPDMYADVPASVTVHRLSFKGFFDLFNWFRLAKLLSELRPDIALTSLFFSNTILRMIAFTKSFPIVAIEHNTNTWKNSMQIWIDRFLSQRSRVLVACSTTVANFAAKQMRMPRPRFTVIHNGVDIERIKTSHTAEMNPAKLRAEFGFTDSDRVVLNVARLTHQKNHPMLIEAFARFVREFPAYRLLILGDGPQRSKIERLVEQERMGGKILLAGVRKNIFPYYRIADFFVSASFIEGFSMAHTEALASGLPLVSTKTAGSDEIIHEGVNGIFVEPTVQSLYAGLVRMAQTGVSASREAISASAQQFDITFTVEKYDRVMRDLVAPATSNRSL